MNEVNTSATMEFVTPELVQAEAGTPVTETTENQEQVTDPGIA